MKNTFLTLFSVLSLLLVFSACSKSKTYAERLADERKAINRFIKKENIKVINFEQFEKQGSTTNVDENEYVELQNKVYLQIVNIGSENVVDTFATGDQLTVRFIERDIVQNLETTRTNVYAAYPDVFNYRISGEQVSGEFIEGNMIMNSIRSVPSGWLIGMRFARKGATLKVIVPSKMGHMPASNSVLPYFYELRRISIANPNELTR